MKWRSGEGGRAPIYFLMTLGMLLAGCGSGDGPVNGRLRFDDGTAVQSGSIEFRSLGDGRRYVSRIEPDGRFQLVDDEGRDDVPEGEYEVVVVQIVLTEDLAIEHHDHGHTVPRRFADYYTSDLRATVNAAPRNEIVLTLPRE